MILSEIILIGIILTGGVIWQVYVIFEKDSYRREMGDELVPIRVIIPIVLGALIFVGCIGYGLIRLFIDDQGDFMFTDFLALVGKSLIFVVLICAKSYFGSLLAAFVLSTEVYYLFEYQELRPVPIFTALIDWVFEFTPDWLSTAYTVTISAYSFASSAWDTFGDY